MRTPCCLCFACLVLVAALAIGNPFLDCCRRAPMAEPAPASSPIVALSVAARRELRLAIGVDRPLSSVAMRPQMVRLPLAETANFRGDSEVPTATNAVFAAPSGGSADHDSNR